jgi:hypothetical protein
MVAVKQDSILESELVTSIKSVFMYILDSPQNIKCFGGNQVFEL